MSNLPTQKSRTMHADIKRVETRASNEDLPSSMVTHESTHSLKRHVSWSDTASKSNLNYDVVPNLQHKLPPDIKVEIGQTPCKGHRKII